MGYGSLSEEPRCDCAANVKKLPSTLLLYSKYLLNSSTIFPTQLTFHNRYRYKLPITITDDTGSIDTIAFSFIAEDLVEGVHIMLLKT